MVFIQPVLLLVAGFVMLILSADKLVSNSVQIAHRFKIPGSVIAVTLIAAGTSAPELVTSLLASYQQSFDLSIGNVLGSNIFNILAIGGLSLLMAPAGSLRSAFFSWPILFVASLLFTFFLHDFRLTRIEALILVLGFAGFIFYSLIQESTEPDVYLGRKSSLSRLFFFTFLSLVGLLAGAELALNGAVELGRFFGLTERIIGITIVAVGTSLPELATSAVAATRGRNDIAIGNVIGSNIFNILAIPGLTALFFPMVVNEQLFNPDAFMMLGTSVVVGLCFFIKQGKGQRFLGALLLISYVAYVTKLLIN